MLILWHQQTHRAPDGTEVRVHLWRRDDDIAPRVTVQMRIDGVWTTIDRVDDLGPSIAP